MLIQTFTLLAVLAPQAPAQDDSQETSATRVEDLRARIHDMRMSLLLGGEKVQQAESEAIGFYGEKISVIEERLDVIQSELSEKRATYDVSLDRALSADDAEARASAMKRAQTMRSEVSALEYEASELHKKRSNLDGLVGAVEGRGRERNALAAQLETSSQFEAEFGLTIGGVGLAPPVEVQPIGSPLDDDRLVEDLLARDPVGARRLLFEADPEGYWARFPLQPPAAPVREALVFPLPDLPGRR